MRLQVKDAVAFVLKHRKNKVFKDFSIGEIVQDITTAIGKNAFAYVQDEGGRLKGIIVCEPVPATRTLHVKQWLCIGPCLREFSELYRRLYNGWTITANRRDRSVVYRTERLMQLMRA